MLLMSYFEGQNVEDKVVYFMSLDNVKFRRPVVPETRSASSSRCSSSAARRAK